MIFVFSEPVCFEEFTSSSGNFTTPNYPVKYFTDHQCTWIFHVLPGKSHRQNPRGRGGGGLVHSAHLSFSCSFSAKILPNNRFFEPNSRVDASYLKILDSPQFIVNKFERVWRQSLGTIQEEGAGPEPCMGGWKGAVQGPPGNRQTRLKALPLPLR